MAKDIKIGGHEFKQWQVWTVGIGGIGVTYLVWRAHKSAAASSSTAAADMVTDPVTGQSYPASSVDPDTGLTYSAEISEYGSVAAAEAAGGSGAGVDTSGYGSISGYGTTLGALGGENLSGAIGTTSGTYATNAEWSQAVESGLADIGYSPEDIAAAVGRYLGGLSLTPDQQNIIQVALAEFDPPPVGTFSIIAAPATGTATTGNTTVPAGGTTTTAAAPTLSGGHVVSVTSSEAVVAWTGTGATSWRLTISGPGAINGKVSTVTKPEGTYGGLEAGHTYDVTIQPLVNGKAAGKTGVITIDTPK